MAICDIFIFSLVFLNFSEGDLLSIFGHGSFRNNSYSVVCDASGTCYVSDIVEHSISVFDNSGNIRKRFGNFGESLINFNQPVALAISSSNKLLISDSQNHCIKASGYKMLSYKNTRGNSLLNFHLVLPRHRVDFALVIISDLDFKRHNQCVTPCLLQESVGAAFFEIKLFRVTCFYFQHQIMI